MNALAIRNDASRSVTWTKDAHELIDNALALTALIGRVTTPEENERAVEAQKCARQTKLEIERTRKQLKEPILEFGRLIDETARTITKQLDSEEIRLATMVGDYQELQLAKKRAEEASAALERQRIERERAAELARVAREEAQHRANLEAAEREAQRKIAAAKNAEDAAKAEELARDLERQKQLAEAQSFQQMAEVQERYNAESAAVAAPKAIAKAAGQIVRPDWEIVELDSFALMRARPDLVRSIEFDRVEIKRLLTAGEKLPGVKARQVVNATVRAGKAMVVEV